MLGDAPHRRHGNTRQECGKLWVIVVTFWGNPSQVMDGQVERSGRPFECVEIFANMTLDAPQGSVGRNRKSIAIPILHFQMRFACCMEAFQNTTLKRAQRHLEMGIVFPNGFCISKLGFAFRNGYRPLKKWASEDFPRGATAHPKPTFWRGDTHSAMQTHFEIRKPIRNDLVPFPNAFHVKTSPPPSYIDCMLLEMQNQNDMDFLFCSTDP
jgi:hypothetical protein